MINNTLTIDLLVIGGGINGTGIAADAAGRGLNVILCEQDDLASATSSASSKLIHGGLRYLEQFAFKLVYESLREREILLRKAPHLIHPLPFVLPHNQHLRPLWMIRCGLFLYDHLTQKNSLPKSIKLNLIHATEGLALKTEFKNALRYFDCQTDDARLVIANALTAQAKGARILTRTACTSLKRQQGLWQAELHHKNNNETISIAAKAVVNAAGPWVNTVLQDIAHTSPTHTINLVKGSHIVVPKLYEGNHTYVLQNEDARIVFVMPYQQQFSLIGTTDISFTGDPKTVAISNEEINYLLDTINQYFTHITTADEIAWSYSGVRALYSASADTPAKLSRDYHLAVEDENNCAPLLSVLGGKITTFRTLAEHALTLLKKYFPHMGPAWTATTPLIGGDLNAPSFEAFLRSIKKQYPWLPKTLLQRYTQSYGSLIHVLLKDTADITDLGEHYGAGLYEKEIAYLKQHEWAQTIEDIIWRRTKIGLFLTTKQKEHLTQIFA